MGCVRVCVTEIYGLPLFGNEYLQGRHCSSIPYRVESPIWVDMCLMNSRSYLSVKLAWDSLKNLRVDSDIIQLTLFPMHSYVLQHLPHVFVKPVLWYFQWLLCIANHSSLPIVKRSSLCWTWTYLFIIFSRL